MRRRVVVAAVVGAIAAGSLPLIGGCASGPRATASSSAAGAVTRTSVVGTSIEGRPIELIELGDGPATILLIATIHGDEAAGTPLLRRLLSVLEAEPWRYARRTVLVMPETNPDGRIACTRGNAAGADLNRDFPAASRSAGRPPGGRHPEARAIADVVRVRRPHLVVSMHEPLHCVDWDGPEPAATIAARLADVAGLPARRLGARDGSLGAWAGETLGIPTITVELPATAGRDAAADWRRYGPMLLAAVQSVTDAAPRTGDQS